MKQLLEQIPVAPVMRDIIGAFVIILFTFIAAAVVRMILSVIVRQAAKKTASDLDDRLLEASKRWIHWFVYILGIAVLLNYAESRLLDIVGEPVLNALDGANFAAGVAILAILMVRVVSALLDWYSENIAAQTETTLDDEIVPLIERTTKAVVYALALLVVLDHFDVNITGLITVLGVGSLAFALAAQDTLSNMIAGFVIMIDRPFRVGDRLRLPDGTISLVHEIGIRSTKFRTFDNTLIIVPNAELTKSTIHNTSYPAPRTRVVIDVGVGYDSDLDRVRKVMLEEAHLHDKVLREPEPYFAFRDFGDSSLDVSLFCHVAQDKHQWRTGCELREQILIRFRKEGIEIPFPQRVVTIAGKTSGNPAPE